MTPHLSSLSFLIPVILSEAKNLARRTPSSLIPAIPRPCHSSSLSFLIPVILSEAKNLARLNALGQHSWHLPSRSQQQMPLPPCGQKSFEEREVVGVIED